MANLKSELIKLRESIKEYSQSTAETLQATAADYAEQFKKRYDELSEATRSKLAQKYEDAARAYEDTKHASKEAGQAAYEKMLEKMQDLNSEIEEADRRQS